MKKLSMTMTMIAMLVTVGMVYGQDAVQKSSETVKLTIDGSADLDLVYRDKVVEEVIAGAVAPGTSFYTGLYTLRFTATVDGKADVVIKLQNPLYLGGIDPLGDNSEYVRIREGYLKLNEFLDQSLTFTVGIQPLKFENRKGTAFVMDISESESFFGDVLGGGAAVNTHDPVGMRLTWAAGGSAGKPQAIVDFFWLTVTEAGANSADETVAGANMVYMLPAGGIAKKDSTLSLLVFATSGPGIAGSDQTVWTLGGGLDLMDVASVDGLEAFGEVYFQNGEAGGESSLDASGLAFNIGGKYSHENYWFEAAYWSISGDDDDTDGDENRFLSYENVEDFLIMESRLGFDIDTNYTAVKVSAGAALDWKGKQNLDVSLHLGFFSGDEDVIGTEDNYGTEIDLKAKLAYSKAVSFDATLAFLTSSDVVQDVTDAVTGGDGDDNANMFTIGTNVKF